MGSVGWGARALEELPCGSFVCEYAGASSSSGSVLACSSLLRCLRDARRGAAGRRRRAAGARKGRVSLQPAHPKAMPRLGRTGAGGGE